MAVNTDLSLLNFPEKLWYMVNEPKCEQIHWNSDGTGIVIPNNQEFVAKVLNNPSKILFKTKNFSSFVRQLNLYGFRKVSEHKKIGQSQPVATDRSEFKHPSFRKDRKDLLEDVKRHANTNKKEETPSEEKPRASNNEPYMRHLYPSVNSNAPSTLGNMWTNWDPFLCPFSWMPYGGAAGAYTMPNTPSYQAQGYYGKDGLQYYLPHYAPVPPSAPYSYEDVCDGNRIATVAHENTVVASGPVSLASQYTPSAVMMNNSLPPARDAVSTGNSFHGNTDVSKSGLHGNRILGNAFRLHEEAKKPIAAQTAEVSTTSNSRTASVRDWKSSEEPVDGLNQSNKTLNETKAEKLRGFDHDKGSIIQDYKKMKFMTMNGDKD